MTDWATLSNLGTAAGTLVLAAATFSAVRSAERSARAAERSVQASLRPLLITSRAEAPKQKVLWQDGQYAHLPGSAGYITLENDVVYLAASIRNVGPGLAVIHGWRIGERPQFAEHEHPPVDDFHRQGRDLYIAPGDTGFWHAAVREPSDPDHATLLEQMKERDRVNIDLLYGDGEGGQRTISRFSFMAKRESEALDDWFCQVVRHWNVDRPDPR
ncbi:hypothetical protein [Streptacidiphilus carbonis]|uniref:hypothetical protein n=1 Tax=Streptacidiphilus carbonis TaxID=105422 RepID=UPI001269CD3A|nr:hypothetical protein [Streptacidiphilus carbonis]